MERRDTHEEVEGGRGRSERGRREGGGREGEREQAIDKGKREVVSIRRKAFSFMWF